MDTTATAAIDAGAAIRRLLEDSSALAACPLKVTGGDWHSWRSATFTGAGHEIVMEAADTQVLAAWLAALPEMDLNMKGHLVADIAVTDVRRVAGVAEITIDALTVEDVEEPASEPSAILAAFERARDAYRALFTGPDGFTDAECEPFHAVIDAAREEIAAAVARTPAEHAAKLRLALHGIDQDGQDALIIFGLLDLLPEELRQTDRLAAGDSFAGMIWSTIVDLEAQGAE